MSQHSNPNPALEVIVGQHQVRLDAIEQRLSRIEHQLWVVLIGILTVLGGMLAQVLRG